MYFHSTLCSPTCQSDWQVYTVLASKFVYIMRWPENWCSCILETFSLTGNLKFTLKPEVYLKNLKFTWKPEVYLKTWCFSLRFQVFRFHWNLKFTWKPEFYLETCSYWENEESVLSSKLTTFSTNSFSYTPCFRVLRSLKLGVYLETWGVHWKLNFTWKPVVTKKNTSLCFPLS